MNDARWGELDQLSGQLVVSKHLLDRAREYGDQVQTKRLEVEIARTKDRRHSILMAIAEASVAA